MLSLLYPEILHYLHGFDYGLLPIYLPKEQKYILILKCSKEVILTAHVNNEFKMYLIQDPDQKTICLGILTAFFDDPDEPLFLLTPLFSDEPIFLNAIKSLFDQEIFEIYFFDENSFELLGANAVNADFLRLKKDIDAVSFSNFQEDKLLDIRRKFEEQFSIRTKEDDIASYKIRVDNRLYPNVMIMDLQENFFGFNDSQNSIAITSLVRDRGLGPMQEKDIARLLRRLFGKDEIFLNPFRADDLKKEKRELVDILIVTEHVMLFVQAKDSPNTADILQRSIDRKRKTIRGHIKKASDQVCGALRYAQDNDGIMISIDDELITIKRGIRQLVGLIVVKELFDDDYSECSAPILNLARELNLQINLLDYSQLHVLTNNFTNQASFMHGLSEPFAIALCNEGFPKCVFTKKINASS